MQSQGAYENQIISDAYAQAAARIKDGTASSQVLVYFLKLGSEKEQLEREKLKLEGELLKAKTEALASTAHIEELYDKAMEIVGNYQPVKLGDRVVAEVVYRDGTIIDRIHQVID